MKAKILHYFTLFQLLKVEKTNNLTEKKFYYLIVNKRSIKRRIYTSINIIHFLTDKEKNY